MENPQIVEIQVNNLFGELSYDIHFPAENPVSIITAPNGRGKTTLLNLISFIFNPDYSTFKAIQTVPFDSFKCFLSNGKTIVLSKISLDLLGESNLPQKYTLIMEELSSRLRSFFENGEFEYCIYSGNKQLTDPIIFTKALIDAGNIDPMEYLEEDDPDLYSRYRAQRSWQVRFKYIWKLMLSALRKCDCAIPVKFITADRIQPVTHAPSRLRDIDEPYQTSPLEDASKEIGSLINAATKKYNNAVNSAKDKLPKMFLDDEGGDLDPDDFIGLWRDYRKELTQFQDIGLIDPTEDFTKNRDIALVYPEKGKFLSTYFWAFKDTTEPLKDLYKLLYLFKSILDERNAITGKKVSFGTDGVSLTAGERKISLETLSSGEKHDFIMFYDLIFDSKNGGLVLIDEPEISLHIEWQESYLDKLIDICKLNNLHAIIATHSPNIVSSHYDFLVDKGERDG